MPDHFTLKLKRIVYAAYAQFKKERHNGKLMTHFEKDWRQYNEMGTPEQKAEREHWYPCLHDNTGQTQIEPMYFYQDAWAFENILAQKPSVHFDIGSHHKFIALLSKVVDLTMIDIRPLSLPMASIKFIEGSILSLPFPDGHIKSLSSICVVEHIGLGRYGDPIDPDGSIKAFKEIERVLASGANFYFSVPVEKVGVTYFNAHRSFNEEELLNGILKNFRLVSKKFIIGNTFSDHFDGIGFSVGCYHVQKI